MIHGNIMQQKVLVFHRYGLFAQYAGLSGNSMPSVTVKTIANSQKGLKFS